jgi:hypothetical protein
VEIDQTLLLPFVLVKEFQGAVYMEDQTCSSPNSAGGAEMPIVGGDLKRLIELYVEHAMPLFQGSDFASRL